LTLSGARADNAEVRAFTLLLSGLLGCSASAGGESDDRTWRPTGRIEFEVYEYVALIRLGK